MKKLLLLSSGELLAKFRNNMYELSHDDVIDTHEDDYSLITKLAVINDVGELHLTEI